MLAGCVWEEVAVVGGAANFDCAEAARSVTSDTLADEWEGAIDEGTDGTEGRWKLAHLALSSLGFPSSCANIESREDVVVVVWAGVLPSHTLPQIPPIVDVIFPCASIKFNLVGVVRSPQ